MPGALVALLPLESLALVFWISKEPKSLVRGPTWGFTPQEALVQLIHSQWAYWEPWENWTDVRSSSINHKLNQTESTTFTLIGPISFELFLHVCWFQLTGRFIQSSCLSQRLAISSWNTCHRWFCGHSQFIFNAKLVGDFNLPLWKMMEWVRQLDDIPFPTFHGKS